LAAAKLARAGCRLDDANAARELLGDGWALVDPSAAPPADRMAPGVSLQRIAQLVQQLERLP
jgi:endonuclease YncB( thermonuclease family)